ncbi:MAG: rRNA maturation RNase YbeY [Planctomycetaceae bacterium]|jgi:probable rRNA maturation factor|nr:rRNA maturation RNase YbeY [Planctomycetaceae bacterium]
MAIEIEIQFASRRVKLSKVWIQQAVNLIASDYGWTEGEISIAIVDDPQIHQVNLQFLKHDYPTDVISFDTTESDHFLEGEIIASADTALRVASKNHWPASHELLLYIIHGMLHVIGLDDKSLAKSKQMRSEERHYIEAIVGASDVCSEAR